MRTLVTVEVDCILAICNFCQYYPWYYRTLHSSRRTTHIAKEQGLNQHFITQILRGLTCTQTHKNRIKYLSNESYKTAKSNTIILPEEQLKQRNLSCQSSSPRHHPCPALSEASFNPSGLCYGSRQHARPQLQIHWGFCPRKHSTIIIQRKKVHYLLTAFCFICKLLNHTTTKIKVILSLENN